MLSLRSTGKIIGGAVSLRQLAQSYNLPIPISVIQLVRTMGQEFGSVISAGFSIPGGQAFIFERGVIITGSASGGTPVVIRFTFPPLGCPRISQAGDASVFPIQGLNGYESGIQAQYLKSIASAQIAPLVKTALDQRIGLIPTGEKTGAIPLTVGEMEDAPGGWLDIFAFHILRFAMSLLPGSKLRDRQLYDVAIKRDDGSWLIIAPHALYYRTEWKNFGLAHITDLHVARRIDGFKATLMAAGRTESANRMINWNDSFRGFVKYANYIHDLGALDVIMATGDLVDYLHEADDDENGPGNMLFFRNMILGKAPGPDFQNVEELRVPVFTVPGNHDYRKYPYYLLFSILAGTKKMPAYSSYNLDEDDALVFNHDTVQEFDHVNGHITITRFVPKHLSLDSSARMVQVDSINTSYTSQLNNKQKSYVIQLGSNRIVMIDSEWDKGIVDSIGDWVSVKLGLSGESEANFLDTDPDSEGISDQELNRLKVALSDPAAKGAVIIGVHAPPINIKSNEFCCYFRETQRPANENEIVSFLARNDERIGYDDPNANAKRLHPTWFPKNNNEGVLGYMKWGSFDDYLDYSVSRGATNEFLKTISGVSVARSADVILTGHGHRRVEYRIGKTGDGELSYFMDFYTENPQYYYPSNFHSKWITVKIAGNNYSKPSVDKTSIRIIPGAPVDGRPKKSPTDGAYRLSVPPYADPLSKSVNPQQWWNQHRPLILQTGALGPINNPEPCFTGFRMLVIKNDVIDKIHYIKMQDLRQANYRLSWPPSPPDLSISLRSTGQIVGNSVSLRQLGKQYNLSAPISVRQLYLSMS